MLADLRWLGLDWDEGPDKEGEVRTSQHVTLQRRTRLLTILSCRQYCGNPEIDQIRRCVLDAYAFFEVFIS